MQTIKVLKNQSVLDICLQEYGDVEACFDLLNANNIAITQILIIEQPVIIPLSTKENITIKSFFKSKNIKPATSETAYDGAILFEAGLFESELFQ